jgi:hypothetical protein
MTVSIREKLAIEIMKMLSYINILGLNPRPVKELQYLHTTVECNVVIMIFINSMTRKAPITAILVMSSPPTCSRNLLVCFRT